MTTQPDLLKAIRTGRLAAVMAALDDGQPVELDDGKGNPGLPLAIACFMGHAEIVRELILRGAVFNASDNAQPNSPLAMAIKGGKTDVVKVLIENGVDIPAGMETGLRKDELMLARWKAQHLGASKTTEETEHIDVFEEIKVSGCYGTDTDVLNAEMRRAVEALTPKK